MLLEDVVTFLILGPAFSDDICINLLVLFGAFIECVELRLVESSLFSLFVETTMMLLGESHTGVTSSACMRCVR